MRIMILIFFHTVRSHNESHALLMIDHSNNLLPNRKRLRPVNDRCNI